MAKKSSKPKRTASKKKSSKKKRASQKRGKKKAAKKVAAKSSKVRASTNPITTKGEIFLRDGAPHCRVPIALQKHLGTDEEIPVRVTILGSSFHALLKPAQKASSLFILDSSAKPGFLEFFLYRSMRERLELDEGMSLEVTLKRKSTHATAAEN